VPQMTSSSLSIPKEDADDETDRGDPGGRGVIVGEVDKSQRAGEGGIIVNLIELLRHRGIGIESCRLSKLLGLSETRVTYHVWCKRWD
jgi:hypothetical protein